MRNNDESTRDGLASASEELKEKYSQLEQNFSELKRQALMNETQGLVPAQEQPTPTANG